MHEFKDTQRHFWQSVWIIFGILRLYIIVDSVPKIGTQDSYPKCLVFFRNISNTLLGCSSLTFRDNSIVSEIDTGKHLLNSYSQVLETLSFISELGENVP